MRLLSLAIILSTWLSTGVTAQQRPLSVGPIDAKWSSSLQRIVAIAEGPSQVAVIDPVSNTTVHIGLSATPLCLAVSPNGQFAAVGHANTTSYVNLITGSVVQVFPVGNQVFPGFPSSIALTAEWIYGTFGSLRISTGAVTPLQFPFYSWPGKMTVDPTGARLYWGFSVYDTSSGPMVNLGFHQNPGTPEAFSPDGLRAIGVVQRGGYIPTAYPRVMKRAILANDIFSYEATLYRPFATAGNESAAIWNVPVLPSSMTQQLFAASATHYAILGEWENDTQYIYVYKSEYPALPERYPAPAGGVRWMFFDQSGNNLHVIAMNPFTLTTISGITEAAACNTATLSGPPAEASPDGEVLWLRVAAAPNCTYRVSTTASWIQVGSGSRGTGNGYVTVSVRPNRTGALRYGSIFVGNSYYFNLAQQPAGSTATSGVLKRLPVSLGASAYASASGALLVGSQDPPELMVVTGLGTSSQSEMFIPLVKPALSVGVSPNGLTAVVGHDGWISVVDLSSRQVTGVIPLWSSTKAGLIAVSARRWAYLAGSKIVAVNLDSGNVELTPHPVSSVGDSEPVGRTLQIDSTGNTLWAGLTRFDISAGRATGGVTYTYPAARVRWDSYSTDLSSWISPDTSRLVVSGGGIYRFDGSQPNGFSPAEFLPLLSGNGDSTSIPDVIQVATYADNKGSILTAETNNTVSYYNGNPIYPKPRELHIYSSENFAFRGKTMLPETDIMRETYPANLHWVSRGPGLPADRLVGIVRFSTSANFQQLNDARQTGYIVYQPGSANCASLPTNSVSLPGGGATHSFLVAANTSDCFWEASSTVPWLSVSAMAIGSGQVTFSAQINNSGSSRTGAIIVSGQTFTVTQGNEQVPAAPIGLTPSNNQIVPVASLVSGMATLSWAPAGLATSYDVYFGPVSGPVLVGSTSGTSFQVPVTGSSSYAWRVVAKNSSGTTSSLQQNFQIACTYTYPSSVTFPKEGGSLTIQIVTQPGCYWYLPYSALGNNSIYFPIVEGTGSGSATLVVDANLTTTVKTGRALLYTNTSRTLLDGEIQLRQDAYPVVTDTVTPNAGSGGAEAFQNFAFQSGNVPLVDLAEVLFQDAALGSTAVMTNSCYVNVPKTFGVRLGNNNGVVGADYVWIGGPGASPENNQCVLDGPGSSGTSAQARLQFTLRIKFKSVWAGKTLNIFTKRSGSGGAFHWAPVGTFAVTAATGGGGGGGGTTSTLRITPNAGSAATDVFQTFAVEAPATSTISATEVVFQDSTLGAAPVVTNACYMNITSTGALRLGDNGGGLGGNYSWIGGPSASSPENAQCFVDGPGSSLTTGATTLASVKLKFKTAWAGKSLRIFLRTVNLSYQASAWVDGGVFTVTSGTGGGGGGGTPTLPRITPNAGSAAADTFQTFTVEAPATSTISAIEVVFQDATLGSTPSLVNVCYMNITSTGALRLGDNGGNLGGNYSWIGSPWASSLENTQCFVDGPGSLLTTGATTVASVKLKFKTAWAGKSLRIFLRTVNSSYQPSTWVDGGTFTLTGGTGGGGGGGGGTTTLPRVTPNTGSVTANVLQTFAVEAPATSTISAVEVVFQDAALGSTAMLTNACYMNVTSTSALRLGDNDGNLGGNYSWIGSPWASTPENTQCLVDGPGSTFVAGATTKANIKLKFKAAWAGRNLRIFLRTVNLSYQPSTWLDGGTITVQ